MKEPKKPPRMMFTILFTLTVFCTLIITMFIIASVGYILFRSGVWEFDKPSKSMFKMLTILFAVTSIIIGTFVSFLFSRIPLKPVNKLIEGMNRLAAGDYKTHIYFGEYKSGKELAKSFNTLADELQNTEMLRSDFINNFSHEFKTPIVSILGFARILNKGNISDRQRAEYLKIIEEEAERLSVMATNVLNLTKIENQSILTDIVSFNVSEQIRFCILLLEKKWSEKNLELIVEFGEYNISANEEMLKQVWINLLDNAIKFSPDKGTVKIDISKTDSNIIFTFTNQGQEISPKTAAHIFDKFYQGDVSHTTKGNGLGLTMVKKIVELHNGKVCLKNSDKYETVFEVKLPFE